MTLGGDRLLVIPQGKRWELSHSPAGTKGTQTSGTSTPILSVTVATEICHFSLKFKYFCINMQLNCFIDEAFPIFQSFLLKIGHF